MYDINKLTYGEIGKIFDILNNLLSFCSLECIEDLNVECRSILEYYGSDNLGYTIQKYEELSEIADKIGFNMHDDIIDEIDRLKESDSNKKADKIVITIENGGIKYDC